jgi:ABC-type dipeptide/oligopeptide/nickel transport system permease subunit
MNPRDFENANETSVPQTLMGAAQPLLPLDEADTFDDPSGAPAAIQGRSPLRLAFDRLRRDRGAMISLFVIGVIALVAIFAPLFAKITGHGPYDQYYGSDAKNPVTELPVGPNAHFWLGSDNLGRDVLVRIAYGARVSLEVGLGATAVTVVVGLIFGLLSGYFGGIIDTVIARIIDVFLAVPYLLFAVAIIAVLGHVTIPLLIVILASFGWASVARIIRGQVISLREREFVEAARSLGAGNMRIMFIDLLPNVIAPAIVFSTLLIPVSVLSEAALSFLGIGIQAPTADWGEMISDAAKLYQVAWWFLLFPSLALLITTLAFNILGDGVRDAFDPRSDRVIVPRPNRKKRKKIKQQQAEFRKQQAELAQQSQLTGYSND